MSPFPMPEVTCPEPGDVVHYTEPSGFVQWANIVGKPDHGDRVAPRWDLQLFNEHGEGASVTKHAERVTLVAKGREGSPPPFAAGDVVDYRDSDQAESPGTYRGTITGPSFTGERWHVDLDNGGEEHALPAELTLVRHAGDDEAPDCTRCGHFAANHEGGAGVCLAKDDGVYACLCFTYTADPDPGKDPNAPDDLQQDPAHRKPRQCTRCGHPMSEHTGRGGCCEDLPCACYGYSEDPGAEMPPKEAPRMHVVHATLPPGEVRSVSSTGAEKGTKPERFDLIPPEALATVARHYGVGALKYEDHNWRRGYEWSKSYSALQRHAHAFWAGEDADEETGSPHMAAVAFHALTLLTFMAEQPGMDDRYTAKEAASE